ncbi:MAG: PAS domain S-box protein [Planctomycetota bacterium]
MSFSLVFVASLAIVTLLGLRGVPLTPYLGRVAHEKAEVFGSLSLTADLKKQLLLRWLEELRDDAHVNARNQLVADAVCRLRDTIGELATAGETGSRLWSEARGTATYHTLAEFITDFRDTYGVYERIHIADAQSGMIILSTEETDLGADVSSFAPFTRALGSGDDYVSDVEARENAHPVFHIAHVVQDEGGETVAVLLLEVSTEDIIRPMLLAGGQLGRTGEALLVNRDVRILTSLKYELPDGTAARPMRYQIQARPAVLAAGGGEGLIEANDYRGEPVLAAYRHIRVTPEFGWGLVVKRDKDDLFAAVREEINYTALTAMLGILAIILLTSIVARRLTGPLLALSDTADRVAAGDLEARAVVSGGDEVHTLGTTFNSMIQRIQNWHRDLEERVHTRTTELHQANNDLEAEIVERKRAEEEIERLSGQNRLILESAGEGIYGLDLNGHTTFVNPAAARMIGWEVAELIGRSQHDVLHYAKPDETAYPKEECRIYAALRDGAVHHVDDEVFWRKDGTSFPVEYISTPIREDGKLAGAVVVFRDITDRKQAEEELRGSKAMQQLVMDNIPQFIFWKDRNSVYLGCNENFARVAGVSEPKNVIGKTDYDLAWKKEEADFFREYDRRVMESDTPEYHIIEPQLQDDGKQAWLDTSKVPLHDADGKVVGILGTYEDITERKQVEEERRNLQDQLLQARKMEVVGQLAGGVAHDFNNILTAILGNAEMLLSKLARDPAAISTEFARNGLNEIQHAGERATALTRRLLGFSRKQMVRPEVLNPCRVLANTETMLRRLIREDVVLDMHVDPKVSCIRSDAAQIEQVIMNLVVNACDAMPDGGRLIVECADAELDDAHVAAHPEAEPGPHVVLSVKDEGTGMSLEIISRIFEPFFTTKPVGRGTGLGLATAYGIAAQAGGHITVESKPGEGSTFRVYIPAVEGEPVESRSEDSVDDLRGEGLVLVCEDEELVRHVTCHILREAGYTVLEAENGRRALEVAADHNGTIDLLITDLVMPEMNGKELAEQMAERHPEVGIVFVSGYTADVVDRRVAEHELENFLQKPFSPAALLLQTRDALAKRKLATTHKN